MSEELEKPEKENVDKNSFWYHQEPKDVKPTREKNSGEILAVDEPNSGIKDNIMRMMSSGSFAHAALGTGLKEEQAKAMIIQSRKVPKYAEYSENQKDVKIFNEFMKMREQKENDIIQTQK